MPQTIILPGNQDGFVSQNNVIYFGVRNELGYHLDDIFLYTVEHHYYDYRNQPAQCRIYASNTEARVLFKKMVTELNSRRYNRQRPDYLELDPVEINRGYSLLNPETNSRPFWGFQLPIQIPTLEELNNARITYNPNSENIRILTPVANPKKVVIVGKEDGSEFIKSANIWIRRKKYVRITDYFLKKIIDSGLGAVHALQKSGTGRSPVNEIFFSTHGSVYAIDFNNPGSNLYISRDYTRHIVNDMDWNGNFDKAFIQNIGNLVRSGQIAENVTITLGGCFNAARPKDVEDYYNSIKLEDEGQRALRWVAMNNSELNGIEMNSVNYKPKNFAYMLSLELPRATIIGPMTRNAAEIGLYAPVVYQNGKRWYVSYPDRDLNRKEINGINGEITSTLLPLENLCEER